MTSYHLTVSSSNRKLGKGVAATTHSWDTCPNDCPMASKCYGKRSFQGMHAKKVDEGLRGGDWFSLINKINSLKDKQKLRVSVSGDLPHKDGALDVGKLRMLQHVCKNRQLKAWTYTHHHNKESTKRLNLSAIREINNDHLVINLSFEDRLEAARYQQAGYNCAVVDSELFDAAVTSINELQKLPQYGTTQFFPCPEQYMKDRDCANCGMCHTTSRTRPVVVFKEH
jgi:hypothetical protein